MNIPVPTPPKKRRPQNNTKERRKDIVPNLRKKADNSKKLITYICTIPRRGELVQVEVRATELLDVGNICHEKHGEYPVDVKKKPFEMPEHLTQRLSNHEGLRALAKSLNKESGRK